MNTSNTLKHYDNNTIAPGILEKLFHYFLITNPKKTPHTVNTPRQIAYVFATIPQHYNSIIAIAYDALISPALSADIIDCLQALNHDDLVVANDAYTTLRGYKESDYIIQCAIAQTPFDALKQLNTLLVNGKLKTKLVPYFKKDLVNKK
ncbi:MAG: hypothetical protein HOP02_10520 [Methylococcaceae bacterium]|nr:hypothetical protein [Methylococcaceae bacterium]